MKLETERLILRKWENDDAKWLYEYAKDPRIGPIAGWPVHKSVEYSQKIIQNVLSNEGHFAMDLKEVGHIVGGIGYHYLENSEINEAEIGYWIGFPFWSCGYTSEALEKLVDYCFKELNLDRIRCSFFEGNIGSKKVALKCGFIYDHSNQNVYSTLLNVRRIEHVCYLEREQYFNNQVNR